MAEPAEGAVDQQDGGEEPPKKKGKLLLIVGLLAGLGGGGAAGAKFLAPMIGERLANSAGEGGAEAGATDEDHGDEASGEGGGGGGEEGDEGGEGSTLVLHSIQQIVVNPAQTNGMRFLLATVAFETPGDSYTAEIEARDLEIRDALNVTLGMKTVPELTDYGLRESLVEEIRVALEGVLGEGSVVRVYLPQFVIQ